MALEVATYINGLNPANPAGSDPLAQADDHFRLIKTTLKNTFPNIDGPVTLTDDQINALETRIDALEEGGVGGGGAGTTIVATLPTTGEYIGQTVYNEADGLLYVWDGTAWVPVTSTATTPDVPPAVGLVDSLPTTATDGDVVFNTADNKLYERVNGAWIEVTLTVNAAQEVADGSITTAKFAQGIRPIEIVASLPTTNNSEGRLVYLTTDDKIYRYTGAAWTSGVATGDLVGTIGADQIAANSITAGKIVAGAIGADQIAANAISTAKLAAGAITTEKLAAVAITADKIATNAITSDKIAANTITAGKIAAAAIGTTQLAASAITSDKIAASSITSTLLAAGAVTATKIAASSITVDKLTSSSSSFNGGTFTLGSASVGGYSGTAQFSAAGATNFGLGVTNTSGPALGVATAATGSYAGGFYNSTTSAYTTHRAYAEIAYGTVAGSFYNVTSNKWIQVGTASYAFVTSGGATGAFTGGHDGLIPKAVLQPVPGDIIVDVSPYAAPNIYDTIHVNAVSSGPNQKGALGVMAEVAAEGHIPTALMKMEEVTQEIVGPDGTVSTITRHNPILDPVYTDIGNYNMIIVNALGEGMMNVCGENGNIEIGDLIVTSSIPGKGMKQADDIVRSYTVAKARESVSFDSQSEVKQVSCIYICG